MASTSKLTRRSTSTVLGDAAARTRGVTRSTATATPTGRRSKDAIEEEVDELESESEDEPQKGKQPNGRIPNAKNKVSLINAKKRKLVDANSAPSSANLKSRKADDADEGGNPLEKHSTGRPTKKRKVEVEVVKFDPEDEEVESRKSLTQSQPRTSSQHQPGTTQESYPLQKVRGKVAVPQEEENEEEDEEEERMVEDALSEAASPRPEFDNAGDDDFYVPYDEVDMANTQDQRHEEAEEVQQVIIPKKPKTTSRAETASKKARSTNVLSSSPPRSSLATSLVPVKIGPPSQKRQNTTKPVPTIKKPLYPNLISRDPSHRSSPSGSLPSLQYPASQDHDRPAPSRSVQPPAPTKEPSIFYHENDYEHVPILSPRAIQRLAQFDEEVMGVKNGKKKLFIPQEEETESEVEIVDERLTKKPGLTFTLDPFSPLNRTLTANSMTAVTHDRNGTTVSFLTFLFCSDNTFLVDKESTTIQQKDHAIDNEIRSTTSKDHVSKPKPTNTTLHPALLPQRTPEPPTNSYDNDIVPETDESQSQEPILPTPTAGPSTPRSNANTLTRHGSLKSRMKPRTRTPSSPLNTGKKDRPLRPIPMLSPSTFHPLLPIPELDSSLPDSIIEPAERSGDAEDLDAPMSSIEEFDSPEKDRRKVPTRTTLVLKGKGRERSKSTTSTIGGRESASEIWDSQVVQRGQAIAEAARKNNGFDVPPSKPKRTVEEIQETAAAASMSRQASAAAAEADEEDEDMEDVSTVPVPPASGPPAVIDEDSLTLQEMEAAYVDLSGGSAEPPVDPVQLRQEEEESTQDLMLELNQVQQQQRGMDSIDLEGGWGVAPAATLGKDSEQGSGKGARLEAIPEVRILSMHS